MPIDLKSGGDNQTLKPADRRIDQYFTEPSQQAIAGQQKRAQVTAEREKNRAQRAGQTLLSWQAPEFEVYEKSNRWYLIAGILVLALAAWGLFTDSPIMSITFILIGIVGYIQLKRDPAIRTFSLTTTGILVDKELYAYENIASFWLFYNPPHTKTLSLHTRAHFMPFVHLPLGNQDPLAIHETLTQYLEEIEQSPSLIDTLERVLHI